MLSDFLYASPKSRESRSAILILPEIFGLKPFAKDLADRFTSEVGIRGYALDYFFAITGQSNNLDYQADIDRGVELMRQMTGEEFLDIFQQAVELMRDEQPDLQRLVVVGFCFGGRLAYLSGCHSAVTDIVSFYGAGSVDPSFYQGLSAIQALTQKRAKQSSLRVMGLFGEQDESIPASDRELIEHSLIEADIQIDIHTYQAGHAFFNDDRPDKYNATAATQAWSDINRWLKVSIND